MCLPTNNREAVIIGLMTCCVGMVIDGESGPKMYLEHLPKGPCRYAEVLLITIHPVRLVPVDYSAVLCNDIPIFGSHQEVFDGIAFLKVDLDPHFATFLKLLLKLLCIGYHHVDVVVAIVVTDYLVVAVVSDLSDAVLVVFNLESNKAQME